MKSLLLIIDPQNDFINGSLPVKNADDCMYKLSEFILDKGAGLYDMNSIIGKKEKSANVAPKVMEIL